MLLLPRGRLGLLSMTTISCPSPIDWVRKEGCSSRPHYAITSVRRALRTGSQTSPLFAQFDSKSNNAQ